MFDDMEQERPEWMTRANRDESEYHRNMHETDIEDKTRSLLKLAIKDALHRQDVATYFGNAGDIDAKAEETLKEIEKILNGHYL